MNVGGSGNTQALWYDRTDMANQLAQLEGFTGDQAKIDKVLAQLDIGNRGVLAEYNLTDKVTIKETRPFLPTPGKFEGDSFERVMFKLETFDFMSAMALLFQLGQEMRETNREMRHGERELAFSMTMNAANEIREAGKAEYDAALWKGITSIVSGSVGIGAAGFGGKAGKAMAGSISELGGGLGGVLSAGDTLAAANHRAKEKEYDAQSQKAQSRESENAEYQKFFADMIQHVITMVKETTQNQLAVDQHIYQNM